jgi:hypothetical protein
MTTPSVTIGSLVRSYRYLLVVLALLVVGAVAVFASAPPGLTWNQASPSPTVVAGGATSTTTISFTATGKLPNAVVQLSPSFAGLVSVSPTNLGTVFQGQTVTLTLTASAPASSTPAVVQGSIQIQKQQNPPLVVYGAPLQVNLNVTWLSVSSPSGFTVAQPPMYSTEQPDSQRIILMPAQETAPDVAPIFVDIEPQRRGPTLYDHLEALGIAPNDITPITINGRAFLQYVDRHTEGDEMIGYVTQFSPGEVFDIASFSPEAADSTTFQAVLASTAF